MVTSRLICSVSIAVSYYADELVHFSYAPLISSNITDAHVSSFILILNGLQQFFGTPDGQL